MAATDQPMPEGTDQIIEGAGAGDQEMEVFDDLEEDSPEEDGEPERGAAPAAGKNANAKAAMPEEAPRAFFDRIDDMKAQGIDRARDFAVQGKDRATGALDDVLRTINDAAEQIDARVGTQYGDYARRAAESLGGFNDALKGKDVDDLFNDARALIAKAPAVAVGAAAALGFVIARLAKAGIPEAEDVKPADKGRNKA